MKVLLRQNITKLGQIGDVVEVKPGYARNYLLPQNLATKPTQANLKAIEADKQRYLEQFAAEQADLKAKAAGVAGREITISARATEEGHLYGSIAPAQIVAALAAEGVSIEPENVVLPDHIRQLDKYDIEIRFAEGISATIHVWIVPVHEEAESPDAAQAESSDAPAPMPDESGEGENN